MAKVCILNLGHARRGSIGAVGHINESVEDRKLGYKVRDYLKQMGWTVHVIDNDYCATAGEELRSVANQAKKLPKDAIFVSIHFNAGGGIGIEIYTYNATQMVEAVKIINNVSAFNGPVRKPSIKDGKGLYVIRNTSQRAMLIEVAFVDNKKDADNYRNNFDKYARAIAEGIAQGKVGNYIPDSKPSTPAPNKPVPSKPTPAKKICIINPNRYSGWVKRLQAELNKQGFRDSRGYRLTVDGYAGRRTLEAAAKTLIKKGCSGNLSKLLQEMLVSLNYSTNGIDGIFGSGSDKALRAWQKAAKISADGVAGYNTWKKLLGL